MVRIPLLLLGVWALMALSLGGASLIRHWR